MLKENNSLKKLDLRKCGLQPEGLEQVIKGVQVNTKLGKLMLSNNTIDKKSASSLGKSSSSAPNYPPPLHPPFRDEPCESHAVPLYTGIMLKENNSLKELDLRKCGLQPEGLEHVIKVVQVNTKLEILILSENTIDNKSASSLGKSSCIPLPCMPYPTARLKPWLPQQHFICVFYWVCGYGSDVKVHLITCLGGCTQWLYSYMCEGVMPVQCLYSKLPIDNH